MDLFLDLFQISWNGAFKWLTLGAALIGLFRIPIHYVTFALKNIIVSILIPIMIFYKTMTHLDPTRLNIMPQYCLWAFLFLALSESASRLISKFGISEEIKPSFHLVNTFNNYGFVAYGLVENLHGPAVLTELFAFVIFTEIALWTRGRAFFSEGKFDVNILVKNLPLWAFILALTFKMTEINPFGHLPTLDSGIEFIVGWTVPLAIIGLGGLIYHQKSHFKLGNMLTKEVSYALMLRHLIMPPCLCLLILSLTEGNLKNAMTIEAVMPSAMMVITLAKLYGGKAEVISLIVFCSQVLSLITIPIWLSLFTG